MDSSSNSNTTTTTSASTTAFLERLSALEAKVGITTATLEAEKQPIEDRLTELEQQYQLITTTTTASPNTTTTSPDIQTLWKESMDLLQQLDPASSNALTHQQNILAPLLYRRQEVLAQAAQLKYYLQLMNDISQLLVIDHPTKMKESTTGSTKQQQEWTEEQVVLQPPILHVSSNDKDNQQIDRLSTTIEELMQRIQRLSSQLDHITTHYHTVLVSTSERLILLNETVDRLGVC